MKKRMILIGVCLIVLMISTWGGAYKIDEASPPAHRTFSLHPVEKTMEPTENYKLIQIKCDRKYNPLPLDIPVTVSEGLQAHPSVEADYRNNPFLLYDSNEEDRFNSDIYIRRAINEGEKWPDTKVWVWRSDTNDIKPDISMMDSGNRAFGTHEVEEMEPYLYLHSYPDIDNPGSWRVFRFDLSPETTYVKDTAITTYGMDTIVLTGVVDLEYHDYNLEDTLMAIWTTDITKNEWPGLFLINSDEKGSYPISHVSAASGNNLYVAFQMTDPNGDSDVYVIYCPTNNVAFENWRFSYPAGGRGNASYPDIAASDKYVYLVVQEDKYGSQDIVCYSSTSGSFWKKRIIASSSADELYPVITANGEEAICLFIKNGNLYKSQTKDGGDTWSKPELVNDVFGMVSLGYRNVDAEGVWGIWTDTRNDEGDIYFDEVGDSPIISISNITGGFSAKAVISNYGTAPAENIVWKIELDGAVIPESKAGIIPLLDAGESTVVKTDFILGFGTISIKVTADYLTKRVDGLVIGSYLIILG
ncbi:MAG: hypothetical protein DRN12_00990 [Thermoplasmata archaeon]|nr:MAG: hypothetical protein DRN12_00990 [Thermoplasmata archaeon]